MTTTSYVVSNAFDYVNSINDKKVDLMASGLEEDEKRYVPFVTNRSLSYFPDTILFVNEMNRLHHLDNKLQYDFLRLLVRKGKRFSKWNKKDKQEDIELIMQYYDYSVQKAESVLDLFSQEDIEKIRHILTPGGKGRK